jgi:hypothetical protein
MPVTGLQIPSARGCASVLTIWVMSLLHEGSSLKLAADATELGARKRALKVESANMKLTVGLMGRFFHLSPLEFVSDQDQKRRTLLSRLMDPPIPSSVATTLGR